MNLVIVFSVALLISLENVHCVQAPYGRGKTGLFSTGNGAFPEFSATPAAQHKFKEQINTSMKGSSGILSFASVSQSFAEASPNAVAEHANAAGEHGKTAVPSLYTGDGKFAANYRYFGANLLRLWRLYNEMDTSIGLLLKDYNVAIRHEEYEEHVMRLDIKHKSIEEDLHKHSHEGRGTHATLDKPYLAAKLKSLEEMKNQISSDIQNISKVPDATDKAGNIELIESWTQPVDLPRAVNRKYARLFHSTLKNYTKQIRRFDTKWTAFMEIYGAITAAAGPRGDVSEELAGQLELRNTEGNFFDPTSPISLHVPL